MMGSVFYKTQNLLYFIRHLEFFNYELMATFIGFPMIFIPMSNNTYFHQYHFSIIPFTYSGKTIEYLINGNQKTFFGVLQDNL